MWGLRVFCWRGGVRGESGGGVGDDMVVEE